MDSLIGGIAEKVANVINTVRDLADRIRETFDDALEFGSPSKIFEDFGGNITAGLAEGMSDANGLVTSATNELATATTDPFSGETIPAMQGSKNVEINVNVTGNTVNSDEELADNIIAKLNRQQEYNRLFGSI